MVSLRTNNGKISRPKEMVTVQELAISKMLEMEALRELLLGDRIIPKDQEEQGSS